MKRTHKKPTLTLLDWSEWRPEAEYRVELITGRASKVYRWGRWWFRVVCMKNGQTILTSEVYASVAKRDKSALAVVVDAGWPVYAVDDAIAEVTEGGQE